jgi:hypothetical protein
MVFNATFNNISGISWWSILLVETVVPGESADPVIFKTDTTVIKSLKCNVIYYQRLAPAYTGGNMVKRSSHMLETN